MNLLNLSTQGAMHVHFLSTFNGSNIVVIVSTSTSGDLFDLFVSTVETYRQWVVHDHKQCFVLSFRTGLWSSR